MGPTIVMVLLFLAYPLFRLFVLSFESGELISLSEGSAFVGLEHYIYILTHERFLGQLVATLLYTVGTVLGSYLVGFAGALLLNQAFWGRNVARVVVLTPWAVSVTVTCLIWIWILDTQFGALNAVLTETGLVTSRIGWLHTRGWAMFSVVLVTTWRTAPFSALMLLAGLQSIPTYLYDAARIDGSGPIRSFFSITIPQLRSVSSTVVLILSIWAFRRIGYVLMLTGGGPSRTTETLVLGIHGEAFGSFEFGRASALSILMVIVTLVYVSIYVRVMKTTEV
jgi:multiple sugar transport system permease protein